MSQKKTRGVPLAGIAGGLLVCGRAPVALAAFTAKVLTTAHLRAGPGIRERGPRRF